MRSRVCTRSKTGGRSLSLQPRAWQEALDHARAEQTSEQWRTKYGTRAGIEGTIHQAVAVTGMRHARYRGLRKTHLEHAFSAVALNLLRLDAWWNGHPLDRTRTGHLARLDLSLAVDVDVDVDVLRPACRAGRLDAVAAHEVLGVG